MLRTIRNRIINFVNNKKDDPIIYGLAAGLYPLIYYYFKNFSLLNSWEQLLFFILFFLLIPIITSYIVNTLLSKTEALKKFKKYALAFINFISFISLFLITTVGFKYKYFLLALVVVLIGVFLLKNHLKKIVVFQMLMAFIALFQLLKFMSFEITYPSEWTSQPDTIESVTLKYKPNIYFIQPDGYANAKELSKGYYNFNNATFNRYLKDQNFVTYDGYRSNYSSTLSSNSSLFSMKHHYYNFPKSTIRELFNARDLIVGDNSVLKILKQNNYKTFLLMGKSYLLINRPNIEYDYCNINADEISYFSRGFQASKDVFQNLIDVDTLYKTSPKFFFLQQLSPGHVTNKSNPGNSANKEREGYLKRLEETNEWLINVTKYITAKDPKALIIMAADHGGFVGMNTTKESRKKLTDADLVKSIFTAKLAIRWPENVPKFNGDIKTTVNLFRILFSSLSEDQTLLEHLQSDKSYIQINRGAPFGVYEYIDENGKTTFNKVEKQ